MTEPDWSRPPWLVRTQAREATCRKAAEQASQQKQQKLFQDVLFRLAAKEFPQRGSRELSPSPSLSSCDSQVDGERPHGSERGTSSSRRVLPPTAARMKQLEQQQQQQQASHWCACVRPKNLADPLEDRPDLRPRCERRPQSSRPSSRASSRSSSGASSARGSCRSSRSRPPKLDGEPWTRSDSEERTAERDLGSAPKSIGQLIVAGAICLVLI